MMHQRANCTCWEFDGSLDFKLPQSYALSELLPTGRQGRKMSGRSPTSPTKRMSVERIAITSALVTR
jgi:hypothetical protein